MNSSKSATIMVIDESIHRKMESKLDSEVLNIPSLPFHHLGQSHQS